MTEAVSWVKWYFDKWHSDPGLRMCSLGARGLWMEMLCIMHNATPYGHLAVNMRACSERDLMEFVGRSSLKEVKKFMRELRDAGVFNETSDGVIYCRRMVRDNETREKARTYGKLGGNPALGRGPEGVNPPKEGSVDLPLKLEIEKEREREKERKKPTLRVVKEPRQKPRSQIGSDWAPDAAGVAYAEARGVPRSELRRFIDHHQAKGSLMADWAAAWRTWCENAVRFGSALPFPKPRDDGPSPMVGGF